MDDVVKNLLSQGTAYLMLVCVIVTYFIRWGVEIKWPSLKKQAHENDAKITYASKMAEVWHKMILRAIPLVTGGAMGIWYIEIIHGDMKQMSSRILFGAIAGFLSAAFYKFMRMTFFKKTGVKLPGSDTVPPAPPVG